MTSLAVMIVPPVGVRIGECQRRAEQAAASERPASQAGNRRGRLFPVACSDGMASYEGTGLTVD
jgi:hypothetical protein